MTVLGGPTGGYGNTPRIPGSGASPYNQGYQAPPRQMNQGGGFRQQFQPPQQQQKQGGGFWRGLGNALKAPFTGGSTTNNYYGGGGGMNQGMNQGMMRGGMNRPPMGGFQQQLRQGGQMNPGMQKPPMGQGQPQWNPTNMFTPGTSSEYINRANVNPWMGNAPGMQPGGPVATNPEAGMKQGGIGPSQIPPELMGDMQVHQQRPYWETQQMEPGGGYRSTPEQDAEMNRRYPPLPNGAMY